MHYIGGYVDLDLKFRKSNNYVAHVLSNKTLFFTLTVFGSLRLHYLCCCLSLCLCSSRFQCLCPFLYLCLPVSAFSFAIPPYASTSLCISLIASGPPKISPTKPTAVCSWSHQRSLYGKPRKLWVRRISIDNTYSENRFINDYWQRNLKALNSLNLGWVCLTSRLQQFFSGWSHPLGQQT